MKTIKQIILGLGLLTACSLQAQEPGHYLHLNIGGGIHDLQYDLQNGNRTKNQFGYTANAAYSWFFSSHWGIQTGAGIQLYSGLSDLSQLLKENATDYLGEQYEHRTLFNQWQERQTTLFLDIPLELQFRHSMGKNVSFLMGAGGKVSIPMQSTYKTTGFGSITTTGYYENLHLTLSDLPQYNFTTYTGKYNGNTTLNTAYSAILDMGALFKMSNSTDLYIGGYLNYGLNNILKADTKSILQKDGVYNGFLASTQVEKVVPVSMGVKVGLYFGFGKKDEDKDGVSDRLDKCPNTPLAARGMVSKDGCPMDSDGDGVPDYLDRCQDTPKEAYGKISAEGCPLDTDGDSIPDYLDKCPDTPKEAYGHVGKDGCVLDTDGDGVPDYLDKCPNTPKEAYSTVDAHGCPSDKDQDGVPDYLDECPNTPEAARNYVNKTGCPMDSDGDGVPDYLDKCPNTPKDAIGFVDQNGCPYDKDGDGVADYLDKCPNTPAAARGFVDEHGCLIDTDGDGIYDYQDRCPKIPGVKSNNGCPEIKKEVKALFKKALHGIQFETGKFIIKPVSYELLNQIARLLIANPTYLVEVQGHTDNVGKPAANLTLSEKRAEAVKNYLISTGVEASRLTSHGYGDSAPVVSNATPQGKAQNRRVEFVVTFEEVIQE